VHSYALQYDTSWDSGSYAQNNYRSHNVLVTYNAGSANDTLLRLSERYYLRVPTVDDRANPRFDDNNLSAGVLWRSFGKGNSSLDYGYRHLVLSASGAAEMEQAAHSLAHRTFYPASRDVTLQANLGFGYGLERRGDDVRRSSSGTLGGAMNWRHEARSLSLFAGANGSVGLVAPLDDSIVASYGGGGTVGLLGGGARASASVTYAASYQKNDATLDGYTLQQRLELGGQVLPSNRLYLHAGLSLVAARRDDTVLGVSANRAALLNLSLTASRTSLQATGGVAESANGILDDAAQDLLFLPSEYDHQTYFATLTASRWFWSGQLTVTAVGRTLDVRAPDRPEQWEHGASLTVSYVIGLLTLSVDDRLSVGGSAEVPMRTANLLYIRLSRTFGTKVL
jgi:hypothetical protein